MRVGVRQELSVTHMATGCSWLERQIDGHRCITVVTTESWTNVRGRLEGEWTLNSERDAVSFLLHDQVSRG